jgi:hypothetical protein
VPSHIRLHCRSVAGSYKSLLQGWNGTDSLGGSCRHEWHKAKVLGYDAYINIDAKGHARSGNDRRAPVEKGALMQIAAIHRI